MKTFDNEAITVGHVLLLPFVHNFRKFKEFCFGLHFEAMQVFFGHLVISRKQDFLNCFKPLWLPDTPSPPQQTIISISSVRISTFTSFDDINSNEDLEI